MNVEKNDEPSENQKMMPGSPVETSATTAPTFRNLELWQFAMNLAESVYKNTSAFPQSELYGLQNQIRRAAVSIPSNVAEGAARDGPREFLRFLYVARGSLAELETQIELSRRLGLLGSTDALVAETRQIGRLLNGLIRHLRKAAARPEAKRRN